MKSPRCEIFAMASELLIGSTSDVRVPSPFRRDVVSGAACFTAFLCSVFSCDSYTKSRAKLSVDEDRLYPWFFYFLFFILVLRFLAWSGPRRPDTALYSSFDARVIFHVDIQFLCIIFVFFYQTINQIVIVNSPFTFPPPRQSFELHDVRFIFNVAMNGYSFLMYHSTKAIASIWLLERVAAVTVLARPRS